MTSDVVKAVPQWTDDELADIDGWGSLEKMATGKDVAVASTADFGTGFSVVDTKQKGILIGVEFAIVGIEFHDGDNGEFATLHIVTKDGRKLIVNDGSTGICQQARDIVKRAPKGKRLIVMCPKGLTRSDYTYVDEAGEEHAASTYYLSYEK